MPRILLVDDEASILSVLKTLLKAEGYDVVAIQDGNEAVASIKSEEEEFDLMISDIRMTPVNGMELLRMAHEARPNMMVIMVTAFGSVETAVEAMKMGAYDYVTKPFKIDELLITVERALEYERALSENVDLKTQMGALYRFETIVAESHAMKNVCEMIEHVSPTDTTVLVFGEKGTGKELVAQTIHEQSNRKEHEFVSVNCAAAQEEELAVKLFGSAGDAGSASEGAYEKAEGGTLYLEEVSSLSAGLQEKLLGVLQDKKIQKVGGSGTRQVDVRTLAGSSQDLGEVLKGGSFREDLYYRLSVIPIEVKPLRERAEDILPLAYHVMRAELGEDAELPNLQSKASVALMAYSWPGNVSELATVTKQILPSAKEGQIDVDSLPAEVAKAGEGAANTPQVGSQAAADDYRGRSLKAFLRTREKEYLGQVLQYTKGDKNKAAKALKISLATLYRKLPAEQGEGEGESQT